MKGSGIDSGDFEYGHFTCKQCYKDNFEVTAYYDDWGNWEVECEDCEEIHDRGNVNGYREDE
jgi:hypothetical protein